MIRTFNSNDVDQIAAIYNQFVLNSHHTFETEVVSVNEMKGRIETIMLYYPFLVYEENGRIAAYAYASRWKTRQAYDRTVESSIYVHPQYQGKGTGLKLYTALIDELKDENIHSVLAGISLPNDVSVHLHEKLGFKKQGVLEEVGFKFGKWIDVGYWNLLL
jgi:phosphinothricin acetyltransferase